MALFHFLCNFTFLNSLESQSLSLLGQFVDVFSSATAIPSRKKEMGVPVVGVQKREFAADRLPVKFQDVKFKDPKFKHEIFMRIDMKHSYFSNYFIICLQTIFSVVENYN